MAGHLSHGENPLTLDAHVTAEERAVREAACAYGQGPLAPRVLDGYRQETAAPFLFRGMGELGLPGATIPAECGGSGLNQVCCGRVAREVERVFARVRGHEGTHDIHALVPGRAQTGTAE